MFRKLEMPFQLSTNVSHQEIPRKKPELSWLRSRFFDCVDHSQIIRAPKKRPAGTQLAMNNKMPIRLWSLVSEADVFSDRTLKRSTISASFPEGRLSAWATELISIPKVIIPQKEGLQARCRR